VKIMPRKRKTQEAVGSEITELAVLDRKGLLSRWLDLFGSDPPRCMRRELLLRAMAHRLQVNAWVACHEHQNVHSPLPPALHGQWDQSLCT
jgi:hypothetical protein